MLQWCQNSLCQNYARSSIDRGGSRGGKGTRPGLYLGAVSEPKSTDLATVEERYLATSRLYIHCANESIRTP